HHNAYRLPSSCIPLSRRKILWRNRAYAPIDFGRVRWGRSARASRARRNLRGACRSIFKASDCSWPRPRTDDRQTRMGELGQSPRQIEDVAALIRVCERLNRAYLDKWIKALGLEDEWRAARALAKEHG